jgi:hypothetical protein
MINILDILMLKLILMILRIILFWALIIEIVLNIIYCAKL